MIKITPYIFFDRVKRVCTFDSGVYNETRHSFLSALLIVLMVAVSHGAGGFIRAKINNWDSQESFVFGIQGEFVLWIVQSVVYFFIAKIFLHKQVIYTEILSAIGYAIFPGILVFFAALLQLVALSVPVLIVLAIYRLTTCTLAIIQLLSIKPLYAFLLVILGNAIGILSLGIVIRFTETVG